jgi:tellurite resistance protein TerA
MDIIKGQKLKLKDAGLPLQFEVALALSLPAGITIDTSCFGVDAANKLSDDRYFVFYNQKESPEGAVRQTGPKGGFHDTIQIDLSRLPPTIKKLIFVGAIDGGGQMSQLGTCRWELRAGNQVVCLNFSGQDFNTEKAIMVGEIYFKDEWRIAGVCQGFAGGLSALLKHFGGQELAPSPTPPPPPPPRAEPRPAPPALPPTPPAQPKVNLGKVTLEKRGQSQKVNLAKGGERRPIHINLNWSNPTPQQPKGFLGGLFGGGGGNADLDLGCMFELQNGQKGVIQPLGGYFGARNDSPFIFLDKDDRSGAAADGENMYLFKPELIKRVLIFAMIYEGTANFSAVNAVLTITDEKRNQIVIPLNAPDSARTFCAVALIQGHGDSISITKDEIYFSGHADCDKRYGFGFRWVAGSK